MADVVGRNLFPPLESLEQPTNPAAFPTHAAGRQAGRQLPASSPIPGSSQLLDEGGSKRAKGREGSSQPAHQLMTGS